MMIFGIIKAALLWGATVIAFAYLTGEHFRFRKRTTVLAMSILAALLVFYEVSQAHYFLFDFLDGAAVTLFCLLFIRQDLLSNMTLIGLFVSLMNLLAVLIIGLVYGVYSTLNGQGEWMVISQAGTMAEVLILLAAVVVIPSSLWIADRLKPAVRGLTGWPRIMIFLLCEGIRLIDNVIKCTAGGTAEYQNDPGGIYMALDGVVMAGLLISMAFLLERSFRQRRAERKDMERQMEEALREYHEITELRQEIRELNHDMRNLNSSPAKVG